MRPLGKYRKPTNMKDYVKLYKREVQEATGKMAGEEDLTCPECRLVFLDLARHLRKAHNRKRVPSRLAKISGALSAKAS